MDLFISCFLFAVGIVLVIKGGDIFVDAASWIAKALHIPTFIIGATIVSLATTLPEMIVSVIAAMDGKVDMAIGNAVGSVTANTGMIMAVAMLAMNIVCARKQYFIQCLMLILTAAVLTVSCLGGSLHWVGSIVLAIIFLAFMVQNVRSAKMQPAETEKSEPIEKKQLALKIFLFVLGAAAIVAGSQLMVNYGGDIAMRLGVPERIISLTLIAIGTSLPELVTTITAIVKKESALSVGNIIGANIIDLSLILPVCSIVAGKQLPVSVQSSIIDIPVCLVFVLMGMVPIIFRQKTSKLQGILLLGCYIAYLIMVI